MAENRVYAMDIGPLLGGGVYPALRELLGEGRQRKADRFVFEKDKLLCAAAGLLLERALSYAGTECRRLAYGENGKPYLADNAGVHFNISHSEHLAVCAVSNSCVGIDAEMIRHFEDDLIRTVFLESEIEQLDRARSAAERDRLCTTLWTVKESVMKYLGTGLSLEPKEIEADMSCEITARCSRFDVSRLRFTVIRYGEYIVTVCSEEKSFCGGLRFVDPPIDR